MNKKILNFIIFISTAGILIISIKDYYLAKKALKKNFPKNPSLSSTPTVKIKQSQQNLDPSVSCQNRYFNFKKGTFWRYKLTSEIEINQQKQKIETFFTNKIIEASNSSVIIETELNQIKEKTTLFCKRSGIYGFPFPSIPNSLWKDFPLITSLKNFKRSSILLLPDEEKLKKERRWESPFLPSLFSLENRVIEEKKEPVLNLGIINTLTIKSQPNFGQFFSTKTIFSNQSLNYQLGEGIGFLNFNLSLNLEDLKTNLRLSLLEFSNR